MVVPPDGVGVGVSVATGFRVREASVIFIVGTRLSLVTICISLLRNVSEVLSLGVVETFVKLKLANSITPVGRDCGGGVAKTIVASPREFASAMVDFWITSGKRGVVVISLVNLTLFLSKVKTILAKEMLL